MVEKAGGQSSQLRNLEMNRIVSGVIPDEANNLATYYRSAEWGTFLLSGKKHVGTDATTIKLGCNVDHNVNYL